MGPRTRTIRSIFSGVFGPLPSLFRAVFPPQVKMVIRCPFCREGLVYSTIPGYTYLNRACAFCDMRCYFVVRVKDTGQPDGKDFYFKREAWQWPH